MQIELEVGCYLLVGELVETDESFDHEFGRKNQSSIEIRDFAIISYNDNIEHDVTDAYLGSWAYKYYYEKLLKHATELVAA